METGYCLQCESLIDYGSNAIYCGSKCRKEALGFSEALPNGQPPSSGLNRFRASISSRGSSGQRSDSTEGGTGRTSSSAFHDYSTSDVGYESTNPTTEGVDDCASGLDDDPRAAMNIQFYPPRRLSMPASPAYRTSPLMHPRSLSTRSERVGVYDPASLLPPPAPKFKNYSLLPHNRSPYLKPVTRTDLSASSADRLLPLSEGTGTNLYRPPFSKKIKSRTRLFAQQQLSSSAASAPPAMQSPPLANGSTKRKVHRVLQTNRGFFLGEERFEQNEDDGSDADSELEGPSPTSRKSPDFVQPQRPGSALGRIPSSLSGQRTPTGSGGKTVWSIAELSLDDLPDETDEEEEEPHAFVSGKPEAESSDEEVARGRPRGMVRRISLGIQ